MGLVAALWGSSYMFIKIALDDLEPVFLVFARCLLGAAVLAPFAIRSGAFRVARQHPGIVALTAATWILAPFILITVGQQHVPSSLAGILVASAPIFTTLIAVTVVQSERLPALGIVGIVVGIVGIALLFGVDLGDGTSQILGGLAILLASLGYAIGGMLAKKKLPDVPAIGVAGSITGLTALALLPAAPFFAPAEMPGLDTVASMVVLGAGSTGLAFVLYFLLNAEIGPSRASTVAYLAPVFSVLYGVVLLDEGFSAGTAAGLVLVLFGCYLATVGRLPWRRAPEPVAAAATATRT